MNRNLAADTKIAVVSELLDVLDDLERGARLDARQTQVALAKRWQLWPRSLNQGRTMSG